MKYEGNGVQKKWEQDSIGNITGRNPYNVNSLCKLIIHYILPPWFIVNNFLQYWSQLSLAILWTGSHRQRITMFDSWMWVSPRVTYVLYSSGNDGARGGGKLGRKGSEAVYEGYVVGETDEEKDKCLLLCLCIGWKWVWLPTSTAWAQISGSWRMALDEL